MKTLWVRQLEKNKKYQPFEYNSIRRAAITAHSHNLLQVFRILPNLVLNDSSQRAKEINKKIDRDKKFPEIFGFALFGPRAGVSR